mgnify:CR=1 FL=1
MIIKNASIYTENHTFVNGNAVVENGRFVSFSDFSEQDAQIVDAQGLYMIPGHSFSRMYGSRHVRRYKRSTGYHYEI